MTPPIRTSLKDGISTSRLLSLCQVVPQLQIEFTRFGEYDGRARNRTLTHDDSSLGAAICPGIREALESGERIVALRRDLYKGEGPVDIFISCRRQTGADVRFPAHGKAGCRRSQTVLSEGDERERNASGYHPRCLCSFGSGGAGTKSRRKMPKRVRVRSSKYLNKGIEQDHRRVKQRIRPMLGFQRFQTAAVTITELNSQRKSGSINSRLGSCRAGRRRSRKSGQPSSLRNHEPTII